MSFFDGGFFDGGFFDGSARTSGGWQDYGRVHWRHRKSEDELPADLQEQADAAIAVAAQAAREAAKAADIDARGAALLRAMEARETYERIYREAYGKAYIEGFVAEMWREDMRRERNRRIVTLLLLN